jgi:hypothetical protein
MKPVFENITIPLADNKGVWKRKRYISLQELSERIGPVAGFPRRPRPRKMSIEELVKATEDDAVDQTE